MSTFSNLKTPVFLFFISLFFTSCSNTIQISQLHRADQDYCVPNVFYDDTTAKDINASNLDESIDSQKYASLTTHDILLLKAIGGIPYLKSNDANGNLKLLTLINSLSESTNAVAAQLDCEGERTDQMAGYISNINQRYTARMTALSIILGAVTTVAAVIVQSNATQNAISISGGILTAGIGAATLNPKGKRLYWPHSENILEDIWQEKNTHHFFPNALWTILNLKAFSNAKDITLLQSIKNRWSHYIFDDEISKEEIALFFGNGGKYTAEDLQDRADMLNQMQASIRSIHQDLASLSIHLQPYYK